MGYEKILFECESNGIATITINVPSKLNAIDSEVLDELRECVKTDLTRSDVKCLIITGAGRSFVAGADISEMLPMDSNEAKSFARKGSRIIRDIERLSFPVIAAINGFALGGGCELALACDIRFASNKAKFGLPEVTLGITPGFGGTQRLPRIVGISNAKELAMSGMIIDAEEAYRIGLVNRLYDPEQLMDETIKFATRIVSYSQIAVSSVKEAINLSMTVDPVNGLQIENSIFSLCFNTKEQKENMKNFLDKNNKK